MKPGRSSANHARRFAAWLMLLALASRIFVPQGWMPTAQAGASGMTLVICSVHGQMYLDLSADGQATPKSQKSGNLPQHPPCAFAGMANLSPPTANFEIRLPEYISSYARIAATYAVARVRLIGPMEARGPPSAVI